MKYVVFMFWCLMTVIMVVSIIGFIYLLETMDEQENWMTLPKLILK